MKLINFIVLLGISFPAFSQIKSGTIVYSSSYTVNTDSGLGIEESDAPKEETYIYTTQFNENYFRSKSGFDADSYEVLIDRKTNQMIYAMTSEIDKTVQYIDLTKSMKELEEMDEFKDNDNSYLYYDEEEEENETPGYSADFYKELLNMKPKDTVVIRTGETKEILGYTCKKVILKIKGNVTETVWYTEELPELNDLSKIHSSIKGFVLSMHMESNLYSTQTDVTELRTSADELSGPQKLEVREGYNLDLGTVYMDNGTISNDYSNPYSEVPDFVLFQDKSQLLKLIHTESEKAGKESKAKKESYYLYFDMEIFFDENGKISEIVSGEDPYNISEKSLSALVKKLKKTVKIQPVTVYGKPVPFKLGINYTSSSEVGPAQYYDEE